MYASEDNPLRASSLPALAQCGKSQTVGNTSSNEAAETGSLIHLGIRAYHETKESEDAALAVMASGVKTFPKADTAKAKKHFRAYAKRATEWGRVIAGEQKVSLTLPPHEFDQTKTDIVIQGTLDQMREHPDGYLLLIDFKTGSKRPDEMLNYYAPQLAAYTLGAMLKYPGREIKPAIVRTLDLIFGGPVLHVMPWGMSSARDILEFVRWEVAQVRAGTAVPRSGKHCEYCPYGNVGNCVRGTVPRVELPTLSSLDTLGDL